MTHPSTPLCIPGMCPCPGWGLLHVPCSARKALPFQEETSWWERSRAEVRLAWGT